MQQKHYSHQQINIFIKRADPDLINQVRESFMIPERMTFRQLYRGYQKLSLRKYGRTLPICK